MLMFCLSATAHRVTALRFDGNITQCYQRRISNSYYFLSILMQARRFAQQAPRAS